MRTSGKRKKKDDYKVRSFKMSYKLYKRFEDLKHSDKTWELVFSDILDAIDRIKQL